MLEAGWEGAGGWVGRYRRLGGKVLEAGWEGAGGWVGRCPPPFTEDKSRQRHPG